MKALIILLCVFVSVPSYGAMICQKDANGKETCTRDLDIDLNGKYQERYDEDMKLSGKWDFISTSFYAMTIVGLGATYYSLNKAHDIETAGKGRQLTIQEQQELDKWDANTKTAASLTGGVFVLGLLGHGMQLHYERKAHSFAIQAGVSW